MKIALIALGVVALLLVVLIAVGYTLPVKHRATASATIAASPDQVYALIVNVGAFPSWRSGLRSVEVMPSTDGRRRWREVSKNGTIPFVLESENPPARLVTRIDSKSLPFGGTWTYDVQSDSGRTRLQITEDGEVYNPIFRLVSRFFIGYEGTMRQYLSDVERKLK
jgi:polyketide cyclase/dehydrase/lipid transport protein